MAESGGVNEGGSRPAGKPGYDALLERQSATTESRFTPCNLVTRPQAQAILGGRVQPLVEAPQGPTCIYRSASGRTFITLAVQARDYELIRKDIRRVKVVEVGGRRAYCGMHGTPVLHMPLQGQRVLSVAAPCSLAKRFAARAMPRLRG